MAAEKLTPESNRGALPAGLSKRRARPWHRVLGLMTALPLVWVVITGALLNHTVDWKLDEIQIENGLILSAYGMVPSGDPVGLSIQDRRVVSWDGVVFLDGRPLSIVGSLIGAVSDGDGIAVVSDEQVLRLDAAGESIEYLDELALPELPLTGVAMDSNNVWVRSGEIWHLVSQDWLTFESHDDVGFDPQELLVVTNDEERAILRKAWSGEGVPASRVLLDLHAAKFLGPISKYFYDLVAICTIWLSVTGLMLFFRKPRRAR